MVRAMTNVVVGDKTYSIGQTISGLSNVDKEWMLKAGYIEEVSKDKKTPEVKEEVRTEEVSA